MKSILIILLPVTCLIIGSMNPANLFVRLQHGPINKTYAAALQKEPQLQPNEQYMKHCLQCHQADGNGVRGMFPPLAGNAKITGPADDVIRIVLFGLEGPVTVNERDYNQPMPPQAYLTDKQISDILTFVRSSWGNKAAPVTQTEVGKVRKLGKPKTN